MSKHHTIDSVVDKDFQEGQMRMVDVVNLSEAHFFDQG